MNIYVKKEKRKTLIIIHALQPSVVLPLSIFSNIYKTDSS